MSEERFNGGGEGTEKGNQNDQGDGAAALKEEIENIGTVHFGKEKV